MQPTEKRKFLEIVNGMAAIKPGKPLTPAALELFWNSMRHWTLADFEAAANHLMVSVEFMPNPYHFEQLRRAGEATAAEAWSEALGHCSQWRTPSRLPQGRIARAAHAVGGFRAIAMADIERDLPHIERRFKEAYEELSDAEETREALPQIALPKVPEANRRPLLDDSMQRLLQADKAPRHRVPTNVRED